MQQIIQENEQDNQSSTESTYDSAEVGLRDILYFLRRSADLLRPYLRQQIYLGLTVVALIAYEVAMPLSLKFLIDGALVEQDSQQLVFILTALGLLYLVYSGSKIIQTYVRAFCGTEIFYDLYITAFNCLPKLPQGFYDRQEPGRITSLFTNDLITIFATYQNLVISGLYAILQLVIIMTTLFIMSWQIAIVVLLFLPFTVLLPRRYMLKTAIVDREMKEYMDGIYAAVDDFILSQSIIRAFGIGEQVAQRFAAQIVGRDRERFTRTTRQTIAITRKYLPYVRQMITVSTEIQQAFINAIVIGIGAYLVFRDAISLGTFSTYVLFIPRVGQAVITLTSFSSGMISAAGSFKRIEAFIHEAEAEPDTADIVQLDRPSREIWLDHVTFSYTGAKPHIHKLNLSLPIGRSMALVGRSGSGKSTLLKLLLGFYQPTDGRVLYDGHDLRTINQISLGSQFGVVLQNNVLMNTTIRENIRIGKPDATDEEIVSAAIAADVHDSIMSLPDGYDSQVGEGGRRLSEGQRQRIALASAIVRNPALLLLDEVTSALDPATEASVNSTIQHLARNRTVILITHRLSSATFMDQIVVMDDGEIKERGRHDELVKRGGVYHHFWQMQSGFEISDDGHFAKISGERLRAIPLFQSLDDSTLENLADQFVSEHFAAGEYLYRQGEVGEQFYIMVRGTVTVTAAGANNQAVRLADLQDGDYFGEVEMLNHGRRTTSVQTKTPSLLLTLHADRFETIMDEVSSLQKVMKQMALGRSLTTISSLGRRRREHEIWQEVIEHEWESS